VSYVLDALRKAEAERQRGSVPSLHAPPSDLAVDRAVQRRGPHPALWALGGAVGVLALAGAWQLWKPGPDPMPAPAAAAPAVAVVAPPAAAPAAPPPTAAPSPAPAVPVQEPMRTPARVETQPTWPAEPTKPVVQPAAPPVAVTAPTPVPAPVPPMSREAATAAPPARGPAPPPAGDKPPLMAELPAELRRQLPPLTVSGSIYSDNPADRFLILNGQLLYEGGTLGPELTLEQIQLKSAVLRYKGQRFRITY